jgi:GDP-4-dehydro-6-deoxy-D-mannose reductase
VRVLVTGAGGFIGSHLIDRLVARGDDVCALLRPGHARPPFLAAVAVAEWVDLLSTEALVDVLARFRPDVIFHLAAQSLPMISWEQPRETLRNNIVGALNLLEAIRTSGFPGRIVVAGSSSEYAAAVDESKPIAEDHPVGASSPYAVSKIAVDQLVRLYHARYGLAVLRVRPFFLIGPRKTGDFCSDMARKVVRAETTKTDYITVGNLDSVRDLLDVRDGIEAMLLVLDCGRPGEAYNICSGVGLRIGDVLDRYLAMSTRRLRTQFDATLSRSIDEKVRIGDPRKLMALGWQPRHSVHETLREILEYWRQRGS